MKGNPDRAAEAMDHHIRSITKVLTDVVFADSNAKSRSMARPMADRRRSPQ